MFWPMVTRTSVPADILKRARSVFGTSAAARAWLNTPAMALDQRRPIDCLRDESGEDMVRTLLVQLEYGVFV